MYYMLFTKNTTKTMWPKKWKINKFGKGIILQLFLSWLYSVLALWPWLIHSSIGWSKLFLEWFLLEVLKITFLCVCKFFYCCYSWVTVCLGKTFFESNLLSLRFFLDFVQMSSTYECCYGEVGGHARITSTSRWYIFLLMWPKDNFFTFEAQWHY